ncbi:hypothetical protein ACFQJ8_25615 [Halocatena marina]
MGKEDELDTEFVGPLLGEMGVVTAIVVSDELNPADRIQLADRL